MVMHICLTNKFHAWDVIMSRAIMRRSSDIEAWSASTSHITPHEERNIR
jgi:hypothetical protein